MSYESIEEFRATPLVHEETRDTDVTPEEAREAGNQFLSIYRNFEAHNPDAERVGQQYSGGMDDFYSLKRVDLPPVEGRPMSVLLQESCSSAHLVYSLDVRCGDEKIDYSWIPGRPLTKKWNLSTGRGKALVGFEEVAQLKEKLLPEPIDPETLRDGRLAAVTAAMREIRNGQNHIAEVVKTAVAKPDKTHKTVTDEASGAAAIAQLQAHFPGIPIGSEDSGAYGTPTREEPRQFLVDGLDGTTDFLKGLLTSTGIVALHNTATGELEQVSIGRPSTGEVWFTDRGKTMIMTVDVETGQPTSEPTEVSVNQAEMGPDTTVLIDKFGGFARDGGTRQILTDGEVAELVADISTQTQIRQQGSNGLNLAQVASGQEGVVASITTAIGGEWDVAGARAVINAGGFTKGYRINQDGSFYEQYDGLNPYEYDILVTANKFQTLNFLRSAVLGALYNSGRKYAPSY